MGKHRSTANMFPGKSDRWWLILEALDVALPTKDLSLLERAALANEINKALRGYKKEG